MNGELMLGDVRPQVNPTNGRFLPGHIPHNKGKRWEDYLDMRKARRIKRIGMKNLHGRKDIGGRNKKKCVGIKDGRFVVFPSMTDAAKATGAQRNNIKMCCQKKRKRAMEWMWFYESDTEWMDLINS